MNVYLGLCNYYAPWKVGDRLAWDLYLLQKKFFMPWYNGAYPPSYKNQPLELRNKATEIANELLLHGADEGVAIATGLKRARLRFAARRRRGTKTTSGRSAINSHGQ